MKAQCQSKSKLRNLNEEQPEEVSVEELQTEGEDAEATPKVRRHLLPESTTREVKNKKSPQKILRMKKA